MALCSFLSRSSSRPSMIYRKKKALFLAATVLSPTIRTSSAFVVHRPGGFVVTRRSLPPCCDSSRLFSSGRNDDENGGILGGLKKVAKSILPSSWFQSEAEKKAAIQREQMQREVKGGLKELLKDAPFPVRMMGNMITPLMSNVMSGLAETMAEQQEEMDQVLADSKSFLLADPAVGQLLGDGAIQVGSPFSQSSSTTSINGQTATRIELAFPVTGSLRSGVAQAVSGNGKLERLVLQVDGRAINVSMSSRTPRASAFRSSKSNRGDDDIIEAEIIEKETRR